VIIHENETLNDSIYLAQEHHEQQVKHAAVESVVDTIVDVLMPDDKPAYTDKTPLLIEPDDDSYSSKRCCC